MKTSHNFGKLIIATTISLLLILLQESFSEQKSVKELLAKKSQEVIGGRNQTAAGLLTFVTYKYIDPMMGMEAFRLLIPKGWQAVGAVTWSANPALPAQSHFRFFNPNGTQQFELFPTQSYFWTDNQVFLYTNPPGSLRFGTLVAQPMDLHTAFSRAVLLKFRSNIDDLKIIEHKKVPELEQLAWEQRQKAQDKIVQNFSDYIRGIERYNDPFTGKEVELPAGYGYAWSNNLGEYIITDSPSYNPNVDSNLNWQQIRPVR